MSDSSSLAVTRAPSPADAAVDYLLKRMRADGRLAWLIGPGSQSYELPTAAYAELHGLDVQGFRNRFSTQLTPTPIDVRAAERPMPQGPADNRNAAVEQFDAAKETIACTLASLSWRDLRVALAEGREAYEINPGTSYESHVDGQLRTARDMLASAVRELDKAMRLAGIDPRAA